MCREKEGERETERERERVRVCERERDEKVGQVHRRYKFPKIASDFKFKIIQALKV